MLQRLAVLFVIAACVMHSAVADQPSSYMAYFDRLSNGESITCGGWLQRNESALTRNANEWFIAGYITAMNRMKRRTSPSDSQALIAFVAQYCRTHPLDDYALAIEALDVELDRRAAQ